jgi:hypothetical protein
MDNELLFREYLKRKALEKPPVDFDALLFDKQKLFVDDPSDIKAALCTRRAGKSYMAASLLFASAQKHPNSTSLYAALTRGSAENILWPIIREIKEKLNVDCELLDSKLVVKFPNSSEIKLVGADMKNFIPRLLGGKYPIGIIDEAQNFRNHIKELVDDVLTPATADYNGAIYLCGTPGPVPSGYFYEVTEKRKYGYSVHNWSILDNPHMPNPRAFLDKILKRNNWTEENPTFRRQYLGEWVLDLDSLVYKFTREKNTYHEIPEKIELRRILSIDYGWNDQTAFSIISYSPSSPKIWVEHVEGHSEMIPTEIANRVKQLMTEYRPSKIVADTGGLGKSITEEMIRRYGIPVTAAEKREKMTNIRLMNGDFIDGHIQVHSSLTNYMDQLETLQKDQSGKKEDPNLPNDLCDATLYAYREARAYAYKTPEIITPEKKIELQEQAMIDRITRHARRDEAHWFENN